MNFALILFVLTVATGIVWFFDRLVLRKRRLPGTTTPAWVEYTGGFFPVICAIFLLRSFVAEPFRIPSGSMIPTLLVGDLILVDKFTYGVRLPVLNTKVVTMRTPLRGEVVVFRPPHEPDKDYIKRVVGIPGDDVVYQEKRLTINGEAVPTSEDGVFWDSEQRIESRRLKEVVGGIEHNILVNDQRPEMNMPMNFQFRDQCTYNSRGFKCKVPEGHYFMMGDNRDNSADSRVWGFASDESIVGRAFFIWMNFSSPSRIGTFR
ncbi:signal peptidase I [soil metagenome]